MNVTLFYLMNIHTKEKAIGIKFNKANEIFVIETAHGNKDACLLEFSQKELLENYQVIAFKDQVNLLGALITLFKQKD